MHQAIATLLVICCCHSTAEAFQKSDPIGPYRRYDGGKIHADGRIFDDWESLRRHLRETGFESSCANRDRGPVRPVASGDPGLGGGQMDCAGDFTNPDGMYAPDAGPILIIDVVFHVIRTPEGLGHIEVEDVEHAMRRLNEEFSATPGTLGEQNVDTGIRFRIARTDPDGNPTFGIKHHENADWFRDVGSGSAGIPYYDVIAWDPDRYLNIYTNDCGYALGYATIPQNETSPDAGSPGDRIVLRWDTVGVDPSVGEPYELNRVLVHEVGHWCGLWHVFSDSKSGGCHGNCHATGDTICDTQVQNGPYWGCEELQSCDSFVPYQNHMSYSDDACRIHFTEEQVRRMRCTLMHWRPLVFEAREKVQCDSDCPADLDPDGVVDIIDFGLLMSAWGRNDILDACADLDGDGVVDGSDIGAFMIQWGDCSS